MDTYSLFGLTLAADFPFNVQMWPGTSTTDVELICTGVAPCHYDWTAAPIFSSSILRKKGKSACSLYSMVDGYVLRFLEAADFYLFHERIVCHLQDSTFGSITEIKLLGPVFAFWLEWKGIQTLHASAVVVKEKAIAFLSGNRGGKSSLAAVLMQAGNPLLTDDILPVEQRDGIYMGRPGYPSMRMWPDAAGYFTSRLKELEFIYPGLSKRRVQVGPQGFGVFCPKTQPLACLYLPQRYENVDERPDIRIEALSPANAVIELLRNSFSPRMVEAAGLAASRLEVFAQLVHQVPVRRIIYPAGFEYLPAVREAILNDLNRVDWHVG